MFFFQSGQFTEDMIPTVGFNMRKITKGNVTIKVSSHSSVLLMVDYDLAHTVNMCNVYI